MERLRKGASAHISTIRRHKARQHQLEDALIAMKQDLEAAQATDGDSHLQMKQARAKAAAAERRAIAAQEGEAIAKKEAEKLSQELDVLREQSRHALASLQNTSCQALAEAEDKVKAHVQQLEQRLEDLLQENGRLQRESKCGDARGLEAMVDDLKRRNRQLQMALAGQSGLLPASQGVEVRAGCWVGAACRLKIWGSRDMLAVH